VAAGDVELHAVRLGDGVPVIMAHGFPGLWYSWRHQLAPLAEAGWQAVALDMRGYGRSNTPTDPRAYTHARTAADLLSVLDALGAERAVFVGHDFGGPLVWSMPLRHPERVLAVAVLSVAYEPRRAQQRPSQTFAAMASEHFLHLHYFQEPGRAEAELDGRAREFLARLFWTLSGQFHYLDIWSAPAGSMPVPAGYLDVLHEPPEPPPWSWLSAAEFEHYVSEYSRTGFSGGLNWYRALDANWEESEALTGLTIPVPALFLAGAKDTVVEMGGQRSLDRMAEHVPDLRGVHLVQGAGHWVQQEAPNEVNRHLLDFLAGLDRPSV